jgi:hypothetical protein
LSAGTVETAGCGGLLSAALALLVAYPTAASVAAADREALVELARRASRGQVNASRSEALNGAARASVAVRRLAPALAGKVRALAPQVAGLNREIAEPDATYPSSEMPV